MRSPLLLSLLAASLCGTAQTQSWQQLIAQQWPGHAIQKVSEKEFEAFVVQHGRLNKEAGYEAFLTAQYSAYGLPTNSPYDKQFLLPTSNAKRPPEGFGDGNVLEGPEPNGDPNAGGGTPTPFGCGDQGEGDIGFGADEDWWSFTLANPSQILAFTSPGLSGPGLPGAVPDTLLSLYDSSSNLIAVNDDFTVQSTSQFDRDLFSLLQLDLPAGTYYLSVRAFGGTQTGNYTLDLQCTAPGLYIAEGPEPNGNPSTGTPTAYGLHLVGDGDIQVNGDTDWWVFTVSVPTSILAVTGPGGLTGGAIGDSTLALLDSTFSPLAQDDDGGPGLYSQIVYNLQPGTYFFEVAGFGSNTGTYRLYSTSIATPLLTLPEGPEPNGDPAAGGTPTMLGCNFVGLGDISLGGAPPAGDDDWWSFTLSRSAFVQGFTLPSHFASLPIGDTTLTLRDATGAQIAFDDDGGIGLFSEIAVFLAPGSYHFDVQGFGTTDIGNYEMHLTCGIGGVATFTGLPGGCAGSNGTPTVQTRTGEVPLLGTTFTIDFVNCPTNTAIISYAGFSNTQSTGGVPLPFDLTPLGAPGCQVEADPLSILVLITDTFGAANLYLTVPLNPSLAGMVIYNQGMVVDPAANNLGLTTTNTGVTVLGSRL